MNEHKEVPTLRFASILRRYRRTIVVLGVVLVLYALCGFLLAPWLVKQNAIRIAGEQFGAELRLERVAINPFVLSLRIDGLELDDRTGDAVATAERIFVNFQLSSLFRWAWTFAELRLDEPVVHIGRDSAGQFNLARLAPRDDGPAPAAAEDEKGGPPRLIMHDLAITGGFLRWRDELPPEPVETRLGPVNVEILGLNTLPGAAGEKSIVVGTQSGGTLSWSGSLQLNPLQLAGHASIDGSYFDLLSGYIRHGTGIDIPEGDTDLDFDYTLSVSPDGDFSATIADFRMALEDVRLQTFPAAIGGTAGEGRTFLRLPSVVLAGGTARWPERQVAFESLDVAGGAFDLHIDEDGGLDILRSLPAASDSVEPSEPSGPSEPSEPSGSSEQPETAGQSEAGGQPAAGSATWRATLDRIDISELTMSLRDASVEPAAETRIDRVDLELTGLTNAANGRFGTKIELKPAGGGSLRVEGELGLLPWPVAELSLAAGELALATAQPYLRPVANVDLASGKLGLSGTLRIDEEDPLRVEIDADIVDFLLEETERRSRLGSWERLAASNLVFSLADGSLEVSELRFQKPYADILITEEGRLNLGRIAKRDEKKGSDDAARAATPEDAGPPLAIMVGRVFIEDASADFADRSLPLPFSARIAALNGDLSTIATRSRQPSRISLEGRVDEHGLARISGTVTPLDPTRDTKVNVDFENVDMPKFSAYSVPFAGRKIASGRLDLGLEYELTVGRLVGDNSIVLRRFELGEKVPHPDAASLPLGLAVALLKDPSGKISVDLPISGDVGDPEFSIGGVVMKALGNLIVKIATSPFALLGKLVGVEASDLEYVSFPPGRVDLTPPEQERAAKLAEALTLRPQLSLSVPGVYAPKADARALRERKLERVLETRIESLEAPDDAMYTDKRLIVLENLYREQAGAEDKDAALEAIRTANIRIEETADGGPQQTVFDAVAYAAALEAELITLQTLADDALQRLAQERAANLRTAIIDSGPDLADRITLGEVQSVPLTEEDSVRMKVALTAGSR